VSNTPEPSQNPRRLWPWLVLAGVILAAVLAYFWISAEVRRVRHYQRFDYRQPATAPATNTIAIVPSTNSPATAPPAVTLVPVTLSASIADFLDALNGGDAATGRKIFFNKPEASCGTCHRIGGQGGDNGPALDGIAARATPEFILESLVAPNVTITKGFETVVVRLKNGSGASGVLRQETETNLVIHTPDDGPMTVNKSDLVQRFAGASPMPANLAALLTKADLRDLMAFLSSQTNAPGGK